MQLFNALSDRSTHKPHLARVRIDQSFVFSVVFCHYSLVVFPYNYGFWSPGLFTMTMSDFIHAKVRYTFTFSELPDLDWSLVFYTTLKLHKLKITTWVPTFVLDFDLLCKSISQPFIWPISLYLNTNLRGFNGHCSEGVY